jgi:anion-transporting  ArsA/GET3 family ATPase
MAKQVKGARANKPNDSFGVVNNSNLYKNKYREDVDKEDEDDIEETIEAQDPTEEVATQGANDSFADAKESHDYKKRYDDLKKHYDAKLNEFRDERDKLASEVKSAKAMQHVSQGMPAPRTVEELQQFKEQYPDIYEVVETVAGVQTENKVAQLREEIASVKEREESLKKEKAYEELSHTHPDFGELKSDDKFLQWLDEQPEQISNGIYKNNTDARWAGKVVSLYKAEMGISTKKSTKSSQNDAAASVTKNQPKDVATSDQKGKIWKMSDIAKLKAWEFEKLEKEIDLARAEGRITQ